MNRRVKKVLIINKKTGKQMQRGVGKQELRVLNRDLVEKDDQ